MQDSTMSYQTLRETDLKHVWHPFTDIARLEESDFPIIDKADGIYLYEVSGERYIDGISSWWSCNLGHNHPALIEAIVQQAASLQHSMLGNMSHGPAIYLAEKLSQITPSGLNRTFFASDGASAVEAALKIALQYWYNKGAPQKNTFVSLQNGYHGDTLGAMGVGPLPSFHKPFSSVLNNALQPEEPRCCNCPYRKNRESCQAPCFESMEKLVADNHASIAAIIVEPLCQGAAGMKIYPPLYLQKLRALCDEYSILLIADEIAVGFYRTGTRFACEQASISPDILCLGKGLTGGHIPMSATMVTKQIYEAFRNTSEEEEDKTLFHGHTFCGHPISAAVALAAIETYEQEKETFSDKIETLKNAFYCLKKCKGVSALRTLGMIAALDVRDSKCARSVALRAKGNGLLIRPLGNVLYLCPPLISSCDQLTAMVSILERSL